jgi:hypothetical protein
LTFNSAGRRGPGRPAANAAVVLPPKREYKRKTSLKPEQADNDEKYRKDREKNNLSVRLSRQKKKLEEKQLSEDVRLNNFAFIFAILN